MKNQTSRVMKMAHILRAGTGQSFAWSDIVRHAWYFERFRTWLHEGLVCFTYLKKDGTIREAKGTLCPVLVPVDKWPKGDGKAVKHNEAIINYYDLDRQEWRSFDIRNFVGYVERFPHLE